MRRKNKRRYTVIQRFTPFERSKSKDIKELVDMGVDPLTVTVVHIGGESRYSTEDFRNLFELTGHEFDTVATSLQRKGDSDVRQTR